MTTTTTNATDTATCDGPRVAARCATTHGTFARDIVLPRLGEDPIAYEAFLAELTHQLNPKNLLEQHYAEKIAAASWRLRRLHRWQAQLFEDVNLLEDDVLAKLDRVMRHETTLHRQIDTSVKMLGRELPRLFEGRVREDLLRRMNETERGCQEDPYMDQWITEETRKRSVLPTSPPSLDLSRLDTVPNTADKATAPRASNCQNEPSPCRPSSPCSEGEVARNEPEGVLTPGLPHTFCRNEPTPCRPTSPCSEGEGARNEPEGVLTPAPTQSGAGGRSFPTSSGPMDLQKLRDWATMKTSEFGERLV